MVAVSESQAALSPLSALEGIKFVAVVGLIGRQVVVVLAQHLPAEINEYFIHIGCREESKTLVKNGQAMAKGTGGAKTHFVFWHLTRSTEHPSAARWKSPWLAVLIGCLPGLLCFRQ